MKRESAVTNGSDWLYLLTDTVSRNLNLRYRIASDGALTKKAIQQELDSKRAHSGLSREARDLSKIQQGLERINSELVGFHVAFSPLQETEKERESAKVKSFEQQSAYVLGMPNNTIRTSADVTKKYPEFGAIEEPFEGTLVSFSPNKGLVRVRQQGGSLATAQVCEADLYYYGPKTELATVVTFDLVEMQTEQKF